MYVYVRMWYVIMYVCNNDMHGVCMYVNYDVVTDLLELELKMSTIGFVVRTAIA